MATPAPSIDPRSARDIAAQVQALLPVYAPAWKEFDAASGTATGVSAALIGIFARFAELIVQRLNRVPEKNLLAYLDLLGAAPLPPQPAHVPLTFFMAAGSANDAVVPAGTRVAAPPGEGQSAPVIFETERELVVSSAVLDAAFTRDPPNDSYAGQGAMLRSPAAEAALVFAGNTPLEHHLYIAQTAMFGVGPLDELRVSITLEQPIGNPDPRQLQWEVWDGAQGKPLSVASDSTANLTQSGEVVFVKPGEFPLQPVNGQVGRWLRCRLLTPISQAAAKQDGRVRAAQLPSIKALTLQARQEAQGLKADALFFNTQIIDQDQDYLPFGAQPKFGDTFYLGNRKALSLASTAVTVRVVLVNPSGDKNSPVPEAKGDKLELKWELWDGLSWRTLLPTADTTEKLTKSGFVSFTLPNAAAVRTIGGAESCWMRVRIVNGNYGGEGRINIIDPPPDPPNLPQKVEVIAASFKPPLISALSIDYTANLAEAAPDAVITCNDFQYTQTATPALSPFRAMQDTDPTLYLGFTLPPGRTRFPNSTLSIYFHVPALPFGQPPDNPAPVSQPRLTWEYWNGKSWEHLTARDETTALTRSGLVEWLGPLDFAPRVEFGLPQRYWVRLRWLSGDYRHLPRLVQVMLNTTMASQTTTLTEETLGASDGSKQQRFQASQIPVLKGQQLEVRELELPGPAERGITEPAINDEAGPTGAVWVPWLAVDDFHASGPRDRHYVLDHTSGEIRFGDGLNGLIPPLGGAGNIRLARYQTGGGKAGNQSAGTITQLQTAIPFVDRVVNLVPASGGADAESREDFMARAPRSSRHLGYAVTLDDYQDLAFFASPEVAQVKCVPLFDLASDPDGNNPISGTVSLIVVPRSPVARPSPSLELIATVSRYLDARRSALGDLVVVGPEYIRVDIEAEVAVESLAAAATLEASLQDVLKRFLHPLTGGIDGKGWSFGRKPHRSDIYALIEAAPGVDHVRTLKVTETDDRRGVADTGRFLVYSGTHRISLTLDDTQPR